MSNGIATDEHLLIPECVHTVTMEWYSLHHLDHVSDVLNSIP